MRIDKKKKSANIKFSKVSEAIKAKKNPEPIMGKPFIKLLYEIPEDDLPKIEPLPDLNPNSNSNPKAPKTEGGEVNPKSKNLVNVKKILAIRRGNYFEETKNGGNEKGSGKNKERVYREEDF